MNEQNDAQLRGIRLDLIEHMAKRDVSITPTGMDDMWIYLELNPQNICYKRKTTSERYLPDTIKDKCCIVTMCNGVEWVVDKYLLHDK